MSRSALILGLAALLTSGCLDATSADDPATATPEVPEVPEVPWDDGLPEAIPGERLRVVELVTPGLSRFVAFWDRELELYCGFRPTAAGDWRCLPTDLRVAADADPTCDDSGVLVDTRCEEPIAASVRVSEVCESPAFEPVMLEPDAETCTTSPWFGYEAMAADPLATDAFVSASEQLRPHGELTVRVLVAEDGAERTVGLALDDGTPCSPGEGAGGALRCVPEGSARVFLDAYEYADASCTELVASGGVCVPTFVVDTAMRVFTPGEGIPDGPRFVRTPAGGCVETPHTGGAGWTLGEPVPLELPEITPVHVGETFTQRWTGSDAGPLTPMGPVGYFESPNGPCRLFEVDGALHCVAEDASGLPLEPYFADPACSAPLAEAPSSAEVVQSAPWQLGHCTVEPVGLQLLAGRFAVGTLHEGPVYRRDVLGDCAPAPASPLPLHTLTPIVDTPFALRTR